jgi:thymidylate synthase
MMMLHLDIFLKKSKMNSLDKQYINLLQDILNNGVVKKDRTGTGTISVFGRTIRHKMSEGFPLITTKKMPFKTIATELIWFLRGDTNIKFLVDRGVHIWDGDAYNKFLKHIKETYSKHYEPILKEEFIERIKSDQEFAERWGDLGPVYGAQWRSWGGFDRVPSGWEHGAIIDYKDVAKSDQIKNLIEELQINPDSRRLMVNAWNVDELNQMSLPPCHYGFQCYVRKLSLNERRNWCKNNNVVLEHLEAGLENEEDDMRACRVPTRAISLMWNQRSVDTFLGLPFNIASYGLLLEIIAKAVNMIPDELIGNLGDTHLYLNHIEQAKEQIGKQLSLDERRSMVTQEMFNEIYAGGGPELLNHTECDQWDIPRFTRVPYKLPKLNINTEFWPTESGECGIGPIDAIAVFNGFTNDNFCKCLLEEDLQLSNYKAHPHIKAPLSN